MIKNIYIDLHVKYPLFLSDFNETRILSAYFRKILKYHISWKPVHWEPGCSMRAGMPKLTVTLAILRTRLEMDQVEQA
jgi:hypothetical protein